MLQPVRYNDRPIEEIFPELVEGLADTLQQFLNGARTWKLPSHMRDRSDHLTG
jgi:hypothetical protein